VGTPVAEPRPMKHILVADDNIAMAALVANSLPGYKVTTAHNGLEALVLAKTLPNCDLVIADYVMPALTGAQLATRLRLERPSVKMLLMTGHGAQVDADDADSDDRLAKPFHVADLREKVAKLIGRAES
jgi:CheY-like chemotaxis protein